MMTGGWVNTMVTKDSSLPTMCNWINDLTLCDVINPGWFRPDFKRVYSLQLPSMKCQVHS